MLAACVALCLFVALLDVLSPSTRGCYEVTIDSLRWIGDMRLVRTDPRMLGNSNTQFKVRPSRPSAGQFSQGSDKFAASFRVGQMSADCRTGGETVSSLVFFSGNGSVASTLV